jgi:ABC-type glycerol-3-phosphate transport system permease component
MLGFAAWSALPIAWLFLTAFRPRSAITAVPPWVTSDLTLQNFVRLFSEHDMGRLLRNSVATALGTTLVTLSVGLPCAFFLSQAKSRLRDNVLLFLLSTKMVPLVAVSLPLFVLFTELGLRGSIIGLVLAQCVASLPFAVWLLTWYFADFPAEIHWAAQLDGHTPWGALWRVVMPMAAPGISVAAAFTFILAWNDYMLATLLTTMRTRPLTAELPLLVTQGITQWGQLAAGTVVAVVPVALLVFAIRGHLAEGATSGALKKA